jgi:hypothetical protein
VTPSSASESRAPPQSPVSADGRTTFGLVMLEPHGSGGFARAGAHASTIASTSPRRTRRT